MGVIRNVVAPGMRPLDQPDMAPAGQRTRQPAGDARACENDRTERRPAAARRGFPVLYAFGFERVGVVVGDLYFVDPNPGKGQEGPEHGVRVELRVLGRGELKGSIYSAQPIEVGEPIWRADLLESVTGQPGSFDRTHHH